MTNIEKLRECFPNTIFIYRKEGDRTTALMCSDEWLESEYIAPDNRKCGACKHHVIEVEVGDGKPPRHTSGCELWECKYEPTTENDLEVQKAIEIIKADSLAPYSVNEILSARDLAVEALKQMTTTKNNLGVDCISRAEAIKCLECDFDITGKENMKTVVNYINSAHDKIVNLPSVTPQPGWISVSERLPKKFETVILSTDKDEVFIADYLGKMNDGSDCFDDNDGMMWEGDVIAWTPLPEGYKESEE